MVLRKEKQGRACAKISERILQILDAQAEDFENRTRAIA
jgi:hypothetical protein